MSTLWLFFFGAKIISQTRRWLLTGRAYAAFINQPSLLDLKEKNRQSNGKILKEKETKNGKRKEEKDGWREARQGMRNSVYRHCGNACACCVYVHHSVSFFCCRFVVQTILTVTVDRRWDTLVRQGKVTSCTSDESQYLSLSSSQLCRMRLHLQLQRLFQTTKHCPALAGASIPLP